MSTCSMGPPASPPLQRAPPPPRSHPQSPTCEDDVLGQLSREELIARIRSLETKNRKLLFDNGAMMKDINHHLASIQTLKQTNYQLVTSNAELREMCCHMDEERSRSKAIAREWQSFGTHMSRVMRHEVTSYSNKLTQLESKQFELVRENFELKQLCLLLDNAIATRENGEQSKELSTEKPPNGQQHRVVLSQQILEYIRNLEAKVQQLEWQKKQLCDLHSNTEDSLDNNSVSHSDNCPPAVAEAMRVLRIHESLDGENNEEEEEEKAIVRSLCNVAWRKIEDG